MRKNSFSIPNYQWLTLLAFVPRLLGAIWLPNAFGDAYPYSEQIYFMRKALVSGSFGIANLFGFWLPLYQLICALISAVVGSPFFVARLVPAIAGTAVCILVLNLTLEITSSRRLALLSFVLIAVNPEHILYSASAMTDVPYAFLVLLCVYCCVRNRWICAAVLGVLAGLMRIEGWVLIVLLPLIQFGRERRVSPIACVVLPLGPLVWLYISWKATGNLWAYFVIRNHYIQESLLASPALAHLTLWRTGFDLARLLYGINPITLLAGLSLIAAVKRRVFLSLHRWQISASTVLSAFFLAHLLFLLIAYVSGNQPDVWPRYGLILFALLLPLTSKALRDAGQDKVVWQRPNGAHRFSERYLRLILQVAIVLFCLHFCGQVFEIGRLVVRSDPNQIAADFLRAKYEADHSIRVYCDNGAVRVMSGIPLEYFVDQYNSPSDKAAFLTSLRERHVRYLVYEGTTSTQFRELIGKIQRGRESIALEPVFPQSNVIKDDSLQLYRVDDLESMAKQKPETKRNHASHYD